MSVVFTRIITPVPGQLAQAAAFMKKRAEAISSAYGIEVLLNARVGGPVGQMGMVSQHDSLADFEELRRKIIADVGAGKLPTPDVGLLHHADDALWLRL
ncbi:MAG: hypothetical protein ACTSUD_03705 [Alphaproteobacteria bacterium]